MKATGCQARSYRRATIVQLHQHGHKQQHIAHLLNCSQSLVSTVLKAYAQHADKALIVRPTGGRSCCLPATERQALKEALQAGALVAGFASEGWTLSRMQTLIAQRWHHSYSLVHVRRLVLALGFSRQVPTVKDYHQDPDQVHTWRSQRLEELKKSS